MLYITYEYCHIALLMYVCYTTLVIGIFQSPNSAATMLSVLPSQRGVAAAISILILSISMMLGIVITFSLVLHALSSTQLFALFIYGANNDPSFPINKVDTALAIDYYILIACAGLTSLIAICLPEVSTYCCYTLLYTYVYILLYDTILTLLYTNSIYIMYTKLGILTFLYTIIYYTILHILLYLCLLCAKLCIPQSYMTLYYTIYHIQHVMETRPKDTVHETQSDRPSGASSAARSSGGAESGVDTDEAADVYIVDDESHHELNYESIYKEGDIVRSSRMRDVVSKPSELV